MLLENFPSLEFKVCVVGN